MEKSQWSLKVDGTDADIVILVKETNQTQQNFDFSLFITRIFVTFWFYTKTWDCLGRLHLVISTSRRRTREWPVGQTSVSRAHRQPRSPTIQHTHTHTHASTYCDRIHTQARSTVWSLIYIKKQNGKTGNRNTTMAANQNTWLVFSIR